MRERASGRCEYCQTPDTHSPASFVVDHINPVAAGGETVLENLAYACGGCNSAKSDREVGVDPEDGRERPLFHPRQLGWGDHFGWSDDKIILEGISPIGRATVAALAMNRSGLRNLRRVLLLAGLHPSDTPTNE